MGWTRSGECNRCGDCCKGCSAFHWVVDGEIGECMARDDPSHPEHNYYWTQCVLFPQAPYPVDLPRCSYVFVRNGDGD